MSVTLKKRTGGILVDNPVVPAKIMKTDYNLNVEKAFWKKLEAAKRESDILNMKRRVEDW